MAEGIREFNAKLLDIAQVNTMACMNFISELTPVIGPTEAIEARSKPAPKVDRAVAGIGNALSENCLLSAAAPLAAVRRMKLED
jgi:hypothetical protein